MKLFQSILQRRSFFGTFATVFAGQAPVLRSTSWQPARETKDDWLDKIPGGHRMMFDSTMPDGFASALMFANNFFIGNSSSYGLKDSDLAVIIVARHLATPFAFNDAMWKKYGATISRLSNFTDPKTKQVPVNNVHLASGSLDGLLKRGVQLAVCEMAARQLADSMASDTGGDGAHVFDELAANLVSNSHMVAAGIVAVNRAQERGYAFVNA
jgi:intracellular sulfur oxidation DsrE/DsrF family protein